MDFVHLDDIFVMFRAPANAVRKKFPKFEKNVPGMIDCSGCSNQRASV
jgi:hypothetical protein